MSARNPTPTRSAINKEESDSGESTERSFGTRNATVFIMSPGNQMTEEEKEEAAAKLKQIEEGGANGPAGDDDPDTHKARLSAANLLNTPIDPTDVKELEATGLKL
jgi:hypothetical protein